MVIVVDGSMGEGGGQILRTSIALSALTLRPVKVINIRAKRSNPGLRRQHITAIKVIQALTDAEVTGLNVGSMTVAFKPRRRLSGSFTFNIGTAGSISLVLQAALPVMALAPGPVRLRLIGGTDVSWSPPIDYVRFVLLHYLRMMGYEVLLKLVRRGHYPRGGGVVEVLTRPVRKLKPLNILKRGDIIRIKGLSHCVRLPKHVAERQARAARSVLESYGYKNVEIDLEYYEPGKDPHLGPGSGIVLWAEADNGCVIGADALGARGKPAERVGEEAARKLIEELKPGCSLDSHMGDMIIPFLAVADGVSRVSTSKLTLHAVTNVDVVRLLVGADIRVQGSLGQPAVIKVKGIGLRGG